MISYVIPGILVLFLLYLLISFRPASTKLITENLYTVRCGIGNFYALRTSAGFVLFDTGISPLLAKRGLRKLGISSDSVTHVFLTHTDFDHAGGLAAFPGAKIFLLKAEEQMINGQTARRGFLRNRRISTYRPLEDGETIVVGDTSIQARLARGHTPGSAVYTIDGHILVCGDLLRFSRSGDALPFLWLMNMNHQQNIKTLEAMRPDIEKAEYILTGHSGISGPRSKA